MKGNKKIVFVYNAKSGLFSSMTDSAHKIISPKTYKCNLCKLTYGALSMKKEWKEFIESLPYEIKFLHAEELKEEHPEIKDKLPAIFIKKESKLKLMISEKEINSCKSIDDLKKLVKKKLS